MRKGKVDSEVVKTLPQPLGLAEDDARAAAAPANPPPARGAINLEGPAWRKQTNPPPARGAN